MLSERPSENSTSSKGQAGLQSNALAKPGGSDKVVSIFFKKEWGGKSSTNLLLVGSHGAENKFVKAMS